MKVRIWIFRNFLHNDSKCDAILAQELVCIAMAVWTGARWELAPPRPQIKYKVPPGWKLKLNGKLNVECS